jgi:hypothetical protein
MRRFMVSFMLCLGLVSMGLLSPRGALAQEATPVATPAAEASLLAELGYPEIRVTTDGTTHDFPTELEAGRYHVVLENQSDLNIDLEFWQLPEGVTLDDVLAFFDEAAETGDFSVPDFFFDMVFNGGPTTPAGETHNVVLDLPPGEWYVNLFTYDPETDERTDTPQPVTVTGEMPELDQPEVDVEIGLIEMDFVVPDTMQAGPQLWQVINYGLQIHHLVLSRIPEGTIEEEVIELAGSFFAPSDELDAGATPAATPVVQAGLAFEDVEDVFWTLPFSQNQFNLYEIDLEPGTYAMICFLPDPRGTPHVMLGMVEIVTVE